MRIKILIFFIFIFKLKVFSQTPNEILTKLGHSDIISCITSSSDERLIASTSYDGTVKVWESTTMRRLIDLRVTLGYGINLKFSPEANFLYVTGGSFISKIDIKLGKIIKQYSVAGSNPCMSLSKNGKLIAIGTWNGKVEILNSDSLSLVKTFEGYESFMNVVKFSHDDNYLFIPNKLHQVEQININTKGLVNTFYLDNSLITNIDVEQHGKLIAVRSKTSDITIFDIQKKNDNVVLIPNSKLIYSALIFFNTEFYFNSIGNTISYVNRDNLFYDFKIDTKQNNKIAKIESDYFILSDKSNNIFYSKMSKLYKSNRNDLTKSEVFGLYSMGIINLCLSNKDSNISVVLNNDYIANINLNNINKSYKSSISSSPFSSFYSQLYNNSLIATDSKFDKIFYINSLNYFCYYSIKSKVNRVLNSYLSTWGNNQKYWTQITSSKVFAFNGSDESLIYDTNSDTLLRVKRDNTSLMKLIGDNELVSIGKKGNIEQIDFINNKVINKMQLPIDFDIFRIAVDKDNSKVGLVKFPDSLFIFTLKKGELLKNLKLTERPEQIRFIGDDKIFAYEVNKHSEIIDYKNNSIKTFPPSDIYQEEIYFTENSKISLINNTNFNGVKIMEFKNDSISYINLVTKDNPRYKRLAISQEGKFVVWCNVDESFSLFDVEKKQMVNTFRLINYKEKVFLIFKNKNDVLESIEF
jgi:uncharacterized protein YuzE